MNHRSVDILVVVAITLVAATLALLVSADIVLIRILTLPLVLVLPGYALTSALFPRRTLGVPEHLVFILSLSLVIVILGGLALNWTSFGLRASSWAVLLGGITLGASAVALVRWRGQSTPAPRGLRVGHVGLTLRQGLLLGLAALIVCGAVAVSIIGAELQSYAGFTQLWILPAGGANAKNVVRLGVSDMESTAMEYRLDVNMDGKLVREWSSIDLSPNQKWVATLVLPPTGSTGTGRVEADLYRTGAPTTIYRHVVLWLGT
jgi:uncharacterized membrane protein